MDMSESYAEISESPTERGIRRPFPAYPEERVRSAFEAAVGAKPFPSEGERRLLERARKFCRPLRFFPGIAAVSVCNSLSMNAADGDSDIDLFIESAPGRIWTARVLTTLYFQLLGARRYGDKVKGRFCLSFFAVRGADFSKISIEDDVYLYEWKRRLVPMFPTLHAESVPPDGVPPISGESPSSEMNESPRVRASRNAEGPSGRQRAESVRTRIGDFFESVFKKRFLPKTLAEYERLSKPWGIRIDDEFLKFHPDDRRVELREKVREGLESGG